MSWSRTTASWKERADKGFLTLSENLSSALLAMVLPKFGQAAFQLIIFSTPVRMLVLLIP
jgi:hypothetical protein